MAEANAQAAAQEKEDEVEIQADQAVQHQACGNRSEGRRRPGRTLVLVVGLCAVSVQAFLDLEHHLAKVT